MSEVTEVKIMNWKQVLFYTDNGVQPIRVERGFKDKVVLVYTKEATQELFHQWGEICKKYRAEHPEKESFKERENQAALGTDL